MNGNNSTEDEDTNNNTNNNHQEELKSRSVSGEYYARGSAEVATESALTLAKVEHVSRIKSAWREIRGRMWGEEDMHILFLFRRRFILCPKKRSVKLVLGGDGCTQCRRSI
jgi:hypothetical protein